MQAGHWIVTAQVKTFYKCYDIGYTNDIIMLTGKMEVLHDDGPKQESWRTGDTMFYKQGVTDPDYCVLKFTAIKGRYYCDLKRKVLILGN